MALEDPPLRTSASNDYLERGFGLYAAQARYLVDYQWRRSEGFTARATQVLAAAAVLLGLLTTVVKDARLSVLARSTGVACGVLLLLAAAATVQAIRPKRSTGPGGAAFRDAYLEYRALADQQVGGTTACMAPTPALVAEQIATMMIGGPGASPIITDLAADASTRGKWLQAGVALLATSLLPLAATTAALILETR